jgi:hypothetical protein
MTSTLHSIINSLASFSRSVVFEELSFDTPIPGPMDSSLSTIWPLIESLSNLELDAVRKTIDLEVAAKLLGYAERMAVIALRRQDLLAVMHGLYALSLDEDILDGRDILRAGVLFVDVCERYNNNPSIVFKDGLRFATLRRRDLLLETLLNGPPYMRNLKAMKLRVAESNDGLRYIDDLFGT